MIKLVLYEVVQAVGGRVRGSVPTVSVSRISTDSRSVGPGDVFFAIPGERFDGHDFVPTALERGAVAAVVAAPRAAALRDARRADRDGRAALIEVDDTVAAFGRLAAYQRKYLSAQVIAVVGSNGKTTTKAMIDHVLSGRLRGRCSPKSFNNAIGVPVTLLSAELSDEYLVVEIGTNAPGEVAALAGIAQPDMAVVTCIGEEHLEGLRDLEGVAAEECAVLHRLQGNCFAAVNVDVPLVRAQLPEAGVTVVTFGAAAQADLRLTDVRYDAPWLHFRINGRFAYRLPLIGLHNASNAAGAIAVARRMGLDHAEIAARLETFVSPPMRNEVIELAGVTIINDAYNANPHSARAALETLAALPCRGRRVAVFGEMRELGRQSAELHRQVAERLRAGPAERIYLVGRAAELMRDVFGDGRRVVDRVVCCETVEECSARLADELRAGDVVLLKASRAVGLDRVVEPLRQRMEAAPVA